MKNIEIDDELYHYIASQTKHIGESASSILRRLLNLKDMSNNQYEVAKNKEKQESNETLPLNDEIDANALLTILSSEDLFTEKKIVNRFLSMLSGLYQFNSADFVRAAASLHGSKRQYLATDETTLLDSGNNTKPKKIDNTPYWVVTNNNTARKVHILSSLMCDMHIPQTIIKAIIEQFTTKV